MEKTNNKTEAVCGKKKVYKGWITTILGCILILVAAVLAYGYDGSDDSLISTLLVFGVVLLGVEDSVFNNIISIFGKRR